jgi:Arm DNA-binding domain/Phage integrase, N-terminal SAM-like domain
MSAFFLWAPFSDNLHFACFQYVLVVSSFRRYYVVTDHANKALP